MTMRTLGGTGSPGGDETRRFGALLNGEDPCSMATRSPGQHPRQGFNSKVAGATLVR